MSNQSRKIAMRRLKRDLIELEQEGLLSISAKPLDNNIFEWHVNIKPTDGVYSGVYFHLIMTFPESYPTNPPEVKLCTPISHPNVFSGFICLSMLRPHTGNVPYEGWSGAYSVLSVCMQLQSFLFAEKIDQDGGYQANARLSEYDVNRSIQVCESFKCTAKHGCGHSHLTPWPKVKGPPEELIKVFPINPQSKHLVISRFSCETTDTSWVGAYSEFGCDNGKVFYEVFVNRTGGTTGLCRFGFGSKYASVCGWNDESFGYDGCGMFSYNNKFTKFGKSFTTNDTITVAVDFDKKRIYFAKNGIIQEPSSKYFVPKYLRDKPLFPMLSFKNSKAVFNFGKAKKPCKWLLDQGFKTFEQVAKGEDDYDDDDDDKKKEEEGNKVQWHSYMIINELWLSIFESLTVPEIYGTQFVCKKWYNLINKYNIIERNEIYCYYTKGKMGQHKGGRILGIGLNIKKKAQGWGVDIHSQMDILSYNAWKNGCRIGVWGEALTHFLPLAMNKSHYEFADKWIIEFLQEISKVVHAKRSSRPSAQNDLDKYIDRGGPLQLIDTLITMMNQVVVQFVMGNKNTDSSKVSMVMCEKVVLGYCALHHLLLYLTSKNRSSVVNFANKKVSYFINKPNGCNKTVCRDLGKFLIYLLISTQYSWKDVAAIYVQESFTRRVRWFVADEKYAKYDTTKKMPGRIQDTFDASQIGRRLAMFQVWFMQNSVNETLKGYNERVGRPKTRIRLGIVAKTKQIINSTTYKEYFDSLGVTVKNNKSIDRLLRFAVWNSKQKGYHGYYEDLRGMEKVVPPKIIVIEQGKGGNAKRGNAENGQKSGLTKRGKDSHNDANDDNKMVEQLQASANDKNTEQKQPQNGNNIDGHNNKRQKQQGGRDNDNNSNRSGEELSKKQRRRRRKRNKNNNGNTNNNKEEQHYEKPTPPQRKSNNDNLNAETTMINNNDNGRQRSSTNNNYDNNNNNPRQRQQQQRKGGNNRNTRTAINNNNSDSQQRPSRPPLRQSQRQIGSSHNTNNQRESAHHSQNSDNINNNRQRQQEARSGNSNNNNNSGAGLSKSQRRKMRKRRKNNN